MLTTPNSHLRKQTLLFLGINLPLGIFFFFFGDINQDRLFPLLFRILPDTESREGQQQAIKLPYPNELPFVS